MPSLNLKKKMFLICSLLVSLGVAPSVMASLTITQWYHGNWDCNIDGRSARMVWEVVDDSRTTCNNGVCSHTSGVKTVGRFSDNGSAWVGLGINYHRNSRLGIRYLGHEQDNWELTYNSSTGTARGWTTWRGTRYPLSCWNRRR